MGEAVTIALDLAKSMFQVHGVDAGFQLVPGARSRHRSFACSARQPASESGSWACTSISPC